MSKNQARFLTLAQAGDALLEEIDDYVDAWHSGSSAESLSEFLGMSESEYALWIVQPDMLSFIVTARREGHELASAVNDNFQEFRMAARSGDELKLKRLKSWLAKEGFEA